MAQFSSPNNATSIVCTPVFNLFTRIQQDKLPLGIALYPDFVKAFQSLERLAQMYLISHEDLVHIKSYSWRVVTTNTVIPVHFQSYVDSNTSVPWLYSQAGWDTYVQGKLILLQQALLQSDNGWVIAQKMNDVKLQLNRWL